MWQLTGVTAHSVFRLTGERSDLAWVLDVTGGGMLLPMPALWLADVALIAIDRFRLPELAFVNPPAAIWATAVFGIGLRVVLGVPRRRAAAAALAASILYVLGASSCIR